MILPRLLQTQIQNNLFKGKAIILYGARQTGKTTLVKEIIKNYQGDARYLNCELLSVQDGLKTPEVEKLTAY